MTHNSWVNSLAFSPDGKVLASGSKSQTIKLWDAATGQEQATLQGHMKPVFSLAFSPDGKLLASGSGDKTIKIWNTATRKKQITLNALGSVESMMFSPDGKTLAFSNRDKPNTVRHSDCWRCNFIMKRGTLFAQGAV